MSDRTNQRADPSANPKVPAASTDVESLARAGKRRGGVTAEDSGDPERDPASADSAEAVAREGQGDVERG